VPHSGWLSDTPAQFHTKMPSKAANLEDEEIIDSDGEVLVPEDPKAVALREQTLQSAIQEIKSLRNTNKLNDALLLGLSELPSVQINQKLAVKSSIDYKDEYVTTVLDLLVLIKCSEFKEDLTIDQTDRLMKLIYKGFSLADRFLASSLLQWHERAVETGGLGSIVRVLCDKQVSL
jgi:actin related protein 2/3 complex subunit 5